MFALQQFVLWCQLKANFPTSVKASHLIGHVQSLQCGVEGFTCAEVLKYDAGIIKEHGLLQMMKKTHLAQFRCKKKHRGGKNNYNKNHKPARNNAFVRTNNSRISK